MKKRKQNTSYIGGGSSPWPTMRGDTKNTGRSRFTKYVQNANSSTKPVHLPTGNGVFSTPVIGGDGTVYVGSADHAFYAFEPEDVGEEKWARETGEVIDSAACITDDGKIVIPSADGIIYAVDASGHELWRFDITADRKLFSFSTSYWWEANVVQGPDGNLYAGGDDFFVYSLDTEGNLRWVFRAGLHFWAASGFLRDGTVIIPGFDMFVYAINPDTGKLRWKTDLGNAITSTPAIDDNDRIYLGCFDCNFYALEGSTGKILWKIKTGSHIYASAAIAEDGTLYITSTDGFLYAISPDGQVIWTFFAGDPIRSSPSIGVDPEGIAPYLVYFGGGNGLLYAVDPWGKRRWSYDTLISASTKEYVNINASPALGDDGIAVASANGDLIWVPYDYYLSEDNPPGISKTSEDGFPERGTFWYKISPGGLISSEFVKETETLSVHPAKVITLRLIVRENLSTIPAKIINSGLIVTSDPVFRFRVEVQSDGSTLNIIPDELLDPEVEYNFKIICEYCTVFGDQGIFTTTLKLKPGKHVPAQKYQLLRKPGTIFEIMQMSIYQPAIVPSLDQIGIASLAIRFSVIRHEMEKETFIAWGVQKFGSTEEGETVGIPESRQLVYAFNGQYRDGCMSMESINCLFEITAFPIPLSSLRFSGMLTQDGSVAEGASLVAEYSTPGWFEIIKSVFGGKLRIYLSEFMSWQSRPEMGWKQIISATLATGRFQIAMFARRIWKAWGLFNRKGKFTGIGTFRTRVIPASGMAIHDDNLKVKSITWQEKSRKVVVDYDVGEGFRLSCTALSILLVDLNDGKAVPINYNMDVKTEIDSSERPMKTILNIPKQINIEPERFEAYVMADLVPLATKVI